MMKCPVRPDHEMTCTHLSILHNTPPDLGKQCNYEIRAGQTSSSLTKFTVNSINVYVAKQIYYENISYNEYNNTYFVS
jgi:hypothetical protein